MPFDLRPFRRRRALEALKAIITFVLRFLHRLLLFLPLKMAAEQPKQELHEDPPFDPSKPSVPISYPITDLHDLESRSYFGSFHYPFNIASVPLPSSATAALPLRPRLLACHDMQGGYTDDRWVQGGANPDAYAIWHWHLIDVFVYFSHSLVTLPPPCWTNAAHTHGVKVLGTFLTEWDEGRVVCKTLLSTEESSRMYAERLAELAATLGFDGWLINMEVKLDLEQIANLKEFVNYLTQTMHSVVPGSLVIWYDSVTKDGDLDWQDQLNKKNKPFFDLCDGIFVNYTWKENYPELSAVLAGDRRFDVYMGIDVFGRNTYGGGQWNTNIALDLLKKNDVSAAIFAPGWVYETKQEPDFQTAQNRWWGLVEQSWGILQSYPIVLPFYSDFDQGHGYHFYIKGVQVADDPWNNISCQGFQPVLDYSVDPIQSTVQVFINLKDASFSGGGNTTCKGSLRDNDSFSTRLFQGQLPFEDLPVHISYSVKSDGNSLMGLCLGFSSETHGRTSILVANDAQAFTPTSQITNKYDKLVSPQVKKAKGEVTTEGAWVLYETCITMSGYILTDINVVCYMKNPNRNERVIEVSRKLKNAAIGTSGFSTYYASLGHVSIRTLKWNTEYPLADSWVTEGRYISWASAPRDTKTVSLKIIWKLKAGCATSFMKYNIFVEKLTEQETTDASGSVAVCKEYLGFARVESFYVSDLEVPNGVGGFRFIIQACGYDGTCQEIDESPALLLIVEGYLKANVDADIRASGCAVSVAVSDENGAHKASCDRLFPPKSPMEGKALASLKGFKLMVALGCVQDTIDGDNQTIAMILLNDEVTMPWRISTFKGRVSKLRAVSFRESATRALMS